MLVEIWSDVVCPWCAIGKARFERALAGFAHREEVDVVFRSFELDPRAPARRPGTLAEGLAEKYGMSVEEATAMNDRLTGLAADEGLTFDFARAQRGSTFDAHRLIHLAGERGCQAEVKAALMHGYFAEGMAVGDPAELAPVVVAAGLDPAEVAAVLDGDAFADEVRADEAQAGALEITGVPFFLFDGRLGIPGAQAVDRFELGLQRAWDRRVERLAAGDAAD